LIIIIEKVYSLPFSNSCNTDWIEVLLFFIENLSTCANVLIGIAQTKLISNSNCYLLFYFFVD
ncbi:hypothetical protein NXX68_21565, partial [Bacteroides fragilis]|nr:hypothetical protein [Bacteroides fragilis]